MDNVNSISPDGRVYLIRLDSPLGTNNYYCGWAINVDSRLYYHRQGKGSRFLREANRRGIQYVLVGDWPGSKTLERCMKNTKNLKQFDPTRSGYKNPNDYAFKSLRRCSHLPANHPVCLTIDSGAHELPQVYNHTTDGENVEQEQLQVVSLELDPEMAQMIERTLQIQRDMVAMCGVPAKYFGRKSMREDLERL